MKIALRKTSLVDYPGKIAAAIFFPGCNLRCPWCHNGDLVRGTAGGLIPLEEALGFVEKRKRILGALVLSGGEPTLYPDLGALIGRLKKTGLPVKLDTNGMRPRVLEELFRTEHTRPDYIAMDLKLAPFRYAELLPAGGEASSPGAAGEALERSAGLVRGSGIVHEFRSLALPAPFFGPADLEALRPLALSSPWHIRPFQRGNCLDPAWNS
ncbi:MAG: anaerobic ribonucleoside-triphosphate reductase activating protein [Treponema sp.]|jgi:pyruvate formate lyase activating enzyme|nr:anaerobic ribonucleoside-triphosphate reductase activating protein [Treponema sp.]